jgi:two-component system sensor histidine kinase RegB
VITSTLSPSTLNLQRLAIIRSLVLVALAGILFYVDNYSGLQLSYRPIAITLVVLAVITASSLWRSQQSWPVTDYEFFLQLLLDLAGITVLLYLSGGATNPFVSYYLVPLCISALILPWKMTWTLTGLALAGYTLLLFYYQPLPDVMPDHSHHGHHETDDNLNLHVIGMWANFAVSALLITFFVVRMAKALREQDQRNAEDREDELRDEQILAVATLAAGTAHELGTPLSTATVLLDEMAQEYASADQALQADIQLLRQQVLSCRNTLNGLVKTADSHTRGERLPQAIDQFIEKLMEHWQVLRPQAQAEFHCLSSQPAPLLAVDSTLEQAITNLLNNAADACKQQIDIQLQWDDKNILLKIHDDGDGIPMEMADQLGKPFITTKGKGLGLGLFLTHATIKRYGGSIELYNHAQQGTVAELSLPIQIES